MEVEVSGAVTPCGVVVGTNVSGEPCCHHLQGEM